MNFADGGVMAEGGGIKEYKGGGVTSGWYTFKFIVDGKILYTTILSSNDGNMGERLAKAELLENFGEVKILEVRQATKEEIDRV